MVHGVADVDGPTEAVFGASGLADDSHGTIDEGKVSWPHVTCVGEVDGLTEGGVAVLAIDYGKVALLENRRGWSSSNA